jgi:hypothetical protein
MVPAEILAQEPRQCPSQVKRMLGFRARIHSKYGDTMTPSRMQFYAFCVVTAFIAYSCTSDNKSSGPNTGSTKSATKTDFKTIIAFSKIYETDSFSSYTPTKTELKYEISFPSTWVKSETVLDDAEKRKVCEIMPGFIKADGKDPFILLPNQGTIIEDEYGAFSVKSKERLKIGKYSVIKYVITTTATNPAKGKITWDANEYFIKVGEYYYGIIFYNSETNVVEQDVVNEIVKSIKLK